ncbi:KH domain-containing protein 3 [Sciurus carolinensis]|uniref:KH domain-containing protein 3 n=1 Tax=Sciurus carolinensis TaxID=30640 RepID=UPI001FB396D3|nr:KH domain-containing protein 3 [Sciurus carolinensis]
MATPKKFHTLVELQQKKGKLFEVFGNLTQPPNWFHSEYLKCPKAVNLEAWLVEAIFGQDGEHIPHVECVTHTLLHVNRWNPDGEAEILIFGRPYYQQDVSEMIMNLADHFRQLRMQSTGGRGMGRAIPLKAPLFGRDPEVSPLQSRPRLGGERVSSLQGSEKAATQETGTQGSPAKVPETGTQQPPDLEVQETGTQPPTKAAEDPVTRL